ncbi:maleate cis-trans isomerase family protein [Compostimonas suwonensis]|uniref:Maleate isomerase/arylmalonate decarboxylase n=1 Tax=Compostimonas suwonensis TaxID=1048394 RepID=A0A2M9BZV3_9MICO|nr:aspartate/glutamate racemase family protein [Compostimonas suwonensis]PJJ63602.1 maleate isomerase/arylmalonate decarboxylase [Compostimonas suwonensis]
MNQAPYGWHARIGLILPSDNVLMEPELNELGLPGVSFHVLRLTATDPEEMRRQAIELAGSITEMGLDVVVYACAETSFNGGRTSRASLSALIAEECGLPVITATEALLRACESMELVQVAVVSPYSVRSGTDLEDVLAENGLTVVAATHRDFSLETDDPRVWFLTNRQAPAEVHAMARQLAHGDADAVLIVSTNLATLRILSPLEEELGKPVLSSNQAIVWWCLRRLGLSIDLSALGRLADADIPEAPGSRVARLTTTGSTE